MRLLRSIGLSVLASVLGCAALAAALTPYGNARFNYWLNVPSELVALAPPQNGDGQAWRSRDGQVRVTAWGGFGPGVLEKATPAQWMAWSAANLNEQGVRLTYQLRLPDGFVLSGYLKNGDILYRKTLVREGTEASVQIEYAARLRKVWDARVGPLTASLRWGRR